WNKSQKPEDILSQWEAVYAEARALDLPEVSGDRAQKDFIQAIRAIDDSYVTALEVNIEQKELDGGKIPELYCLIERFRNHNSKSHDSNPLKEEHLQHHHKPVRTNATVEKESTGSETVFTSTRRLGHKPGLENTTSLSRSTSLSIIHNERGQKRT
ncbi:hypothetical protein HYALB_00014079, partial [Hymenoscyphus albidus]